MAAASFTVPDMLVTTYLQMSCREQCAPVAPERDDVRVEQIVNPTVEFYRFLYRSVGEQLRWRDRLIMPDAELEAALKKPSTSVYVLQVGDHPAGYVELVRDGQATEIAYFGLFPQYQGIGLGKYLLSYAIERAWEAGVERVWVHTCNLDSPHALDNYVRRGFQVYKVHQYPMPERYA
ncbi:MAG: GNAT family N-acetyltransferase [Chloroflexota bacterium]